MSDRLVDTDRPAELLAGLRVLDSELQGLRGDSDCLERKRCQLFVFRRSRIEELFAAVRASRFLEQHGAVEQAEISELVPPPAAVRKHGPRFASKSSCSSVNANCINGSSEDRA